MTVSCSTAGLKGKALPTPGEWKPCLMMKLHIMHCTCKMLKLLPVIAAATSALSFRACISGVDAAEKSSSDRFGTMLSDEQQVGDNLGHGKQVPVVVNTWTGDFASATQRAWSVVSTASAEAGDTSVLLDAVEAGCNTCENIRCGGSVGYGGHPDSSGEVTLDSMVMYGPLHAVGAVGCLRRIKNAATVARAVMEHSEHTMLVGEGATAFAKMMGMREEDLSTDDSRRVHQSWLDNACQPNYYKLFEKDQESCPPYAPPKHEETESADERSDENGLIARGTSGAIPPRPPARDARLLISEDNHDTIGMVIVDDEGDLACGTTTNGAANKIAGRVGDSPVAGAGCYVDNDIGGAAATGDGDVMMRFLPSYRAVASMRNGDSPADACTEALCDIAKFYPTFGGALICVNKFGQHGAAHHGLSFSYSYQGPGDTEPQIGDAVKADEQTCSLIDSRRRANAGPKIHAEMPSVLEAAR